LNQPTLGQHEIEQLLAASAKHPAEGHGRAPGLPDPALARQPGDDIDLLLKQAEEALASVDQPTDLDLPGMKPFELRDFAGSPPSSEKTTLELLRDVELNVKIELGRTHMVLEDVLRLRKGSVVTLDKLAGDPVDVYVNGRLVARGEVLVLNDNFCVRVAELIAGEGTGRAA
jgi:flagellar motor switch protein FliN/FliY